MIGSFGGLTLPAPTTGITTTLAPLDPARTALAGLLKAAINGELRDVWALVTAGLPATHPLAGSTPVRDVLELEPDPQTLAARKAGWPLLCVYREGKATTQMVSARYNRRIQQWRADLILGPIGTVDDVRRFGDLAMAAVTVATATLHHGIYPGHPSATPPVAAYGTGRFPAVPVDFVTVKGHQGPGLATVEQLGGDAKQLYAVTIEIETWESELIVSDPATDTLLDFVDTDLGAADVTINLAVPEDQGSELSNFVVVGPPEVPVGD